MSYPIHDLEAQVRRSLPAKQSISISGITNPIGFDIYDVFGRIQRHGIIENSETQISLSGLRSGIYFLRIDMQTIPFKMQ